MPEKIERLTLKKKYTKAEFRKQAADILLRLSTELSPFDSDADARLERIERSRDDVFFFFQTYLPHYFSADFAPFHYQLIDLLEQRPAAEEVLIPVAVAAPREFAKTTITSFGYVLHQICLAKRHFIIIGSDTEDLASDLTGYLYLELLYNERLRADFGELVKDNWAVDDFITVNDVRLKARGRGQRLRGLKHKQWRPDLVILDDLENDKNVKNPRLVKELLDWIKNTVYPGIDSGGNLFIIGTILARRSGLDIILKAEDEPWMHWRRSIYRAIEAGESIWPARHPLDKLLKQKKLMGSLAFNREKMNDPVDEEGMFQEGWIRYYANSELPKSLAVAGWFDPSVETRASADFKAIVTVGLDLQEMIFYVLDAYIRRSSIEQAIAAAYTRHNQHGFKVFGLEDNLFQKLLIRDFDREAKERQQYLPIRGLTNTLNKETRIAGLSPLVERGRIRFARGQGDQDLLVEQMLSFPSPTVHDDGPDALEGAVRLAQQFGAAHVEYESVRERRFAGRGAW
jgi:predicted phage terminase large subunit-like protein